MANISFLNDNELKNVTGGYQQEIDLKTMSINIRLDEGEDPTALRKDLASQLPAGIRLSAAAEMRLDTIAIEMKATGHRHLYAKLSFSLSGVGIESYSHD